jgi:hypothetical protein
MSGIESASAHAGEQVLFGKPLSVEMFSNQSGSEGGLLVSTFFVVLVKSLRVIGIQKYLKADFFAATISH